MSAAFTGRWVKRAGIMVPVVDPPQQARPQMVWTDAQLRRAHAAHKRGLRDARTVAGEREWQRRYKAGRRAGRLSATDRAWCEKQAVIGSWVFDETTNRASVTNT